jgi:hypothetical protein
MKQDQAYQLKLVALHQGVTSVHIGTPSSTHVKGIKPKAEGLCWDTKTLEGRAKM